MLRVNKTSLTFINKEPLKYSMIKHVVLFVTYIAIKSVEGACCLFVFKLLIELLFPCNGLLLSSKENA